MKNPKIEVLWNHKPIEVLGDKQGVNGVMLENTKTGDLKANYCNRFLLSNWSPP